MDIDDREDYLQSVGLHLGWNKGLVKCQICHTRWHRVEYETCYDCRLPRTKYDRKEFTQDQRIDIMERDDYKCTACGIRDEYLQVDHIMPCAWGGEADLWNGQTLCTGCNLSKGSDWKNRRWPRKRNKLMHLYLTFGWPYLEYEEQNLLVDEALNRREVTGYVPLSGIVTKAWLEEQSQERKIIVNKQTSGPELEYVNIVDGWIEQGRILQHGDRFLWHTHVVKAKEPGQWAIEMADCEII